MSTYFGFLMGVENKLTESTKKTKNGLVAVKELRKVER